MRNILLIVLFVIVFGLASCSHKTYPTQVCGIGGNIYELISISKVPWDNNEWGVYVNKESGDTIHFYPIPND